MGFIEAIKTVLGKYATTSGRARRSEYWYWQLANLIISLLLGWIPFVGQILALALLVPSICVLIRRLHDIGKSGWWILLLFVPLANLVIIVFTIMDSQIGSNEYGEDPKEIEGTITKSQE